MSNPKPVYPEGKGEGLCWIAFRSAAYIDEVRVTARDERWQEIATITEGVDATWSGTGSRGSRRTASWAQRLSDDQQQQMTAAAMSANNDSSGAGLVQLHLLNQPTAAYQHLVEALSHDPDRVTAAAARNGLETIAAQQKRAVERWRR